jgi:serine/threonine protein kinase
LLAPFNHPALVRVHRFWKANGTAYMAMQYCPGVTLIDARRAMRAPPDEAWLRAFVEPILDALERLHRAGVFHRDISPDNILLLPNGRPILLDFGSARRAAGAGTKSLTAVLKPNFAPVEQYGDSAGMAQGAWTDLYALGATVHFMLTGEAPTPAVMRVVNDVRTPLAAGAAFPGVGARFLAAIDWTAAVAPKDRPQSVAALREALGDDAERMPAPAAAPRAKRPVRRGLVALALAAFGVLGVGAWTLVGTTSMLAAVAPPPASVPPPAPTPRVAPAPIATVAPQAPAVEALAVQATTVAAPVAPEAPQAMAPVAKPAAAPSSAQRPGPPKRPAAAAVSVPPAAPTPRRTEPNEAGSRSPAEVCAGRNFISRALCLSRQCQAAGSRLHPECAEARRIEEYRQRRMDR